MGLWVRFTKKYFIINEEIKKLFKKIMSIIIIIQIKIYL